MFYLFYDHERNLDVIVEDDNVLSATALLCLNADDPYNIDYIECLGE